MAQTTAEQVAHKIDLKDPTLAALLAWLVPGAGHLYQGRYGKAVLYLVCILGMFAWGLYLGGGHCVYFQWDPPSMRRYSYLCQVGAGLPALPAVVGTFRANQDMTTLPGLNQPYYMPPRPMDREDRKLSYLAWRGEGEIARSEYDEWSSKWHRQFELGTVLTMIAGLLNILAVYDAWQGPAHGGTSTGTSRRDEKAPAETA